MTHPDETASWPEEPRFLADAMLERLARWLRVLGFDAVSASGRGLSLAEQAASEQRHLLTRDRRLAEGSRSAVPLVIRSDRPLEQLAEVLAHFRLSTDRELFRRCLLCNVALERAPEEARPAPGLDAPRPPGAVPQWRCPACGRLYWEGTHTRRMRAALEGALGPSGSRTD
jgi:uncharacterized protein with PIN domain